MKKLTRLTFVILAVSIIGCTLDNPGMPSWENELTIALEEEKYTMREDLVNDSTIIVKDAPDSVGQWVWINVSDSTSEGDKKKVDPEDLSTFQAPKSYSDEVGTITLDNIDPVTTPPSDLNTLLGTSFVPGNTLPPDNQSRDFSVNDQSAEFTSFSEIGIETGTLVMTINNGLFLDVESVTIDIFNDIPGPPDLVASVVIPGPIPAGTQQTVNTPLAGVIIFKDLLIDYTVTLPPRADPHTLTANDLNSTISITADLENTIVNYAVLAKIPAQTFMNVDSSEVGEQDDKIVYAQIERGMINIDFFNHLPVSGTATVEFKNILENGQPLILETHVESENVVPEHLSKDLSGVEIQNEDGISPIEYFKYTVTMVTDSSEDFVEINATDSLTADIDLDTLFFSYIEGDIARTDLEIKPVNKNDIADYGDLAGGIRLSRAELRLFFYSELGIDINADITITGKHKDEDTGQFTDSLTMDLNNIIINKSLDGITAQLTSIVLSNADPQPNIIDFMEILPTDIFIRGTAFVEGMGSIALNQATWIDYELDSPLAIEIPVPIELLGDKTEVDSGDVSSDTKDFLMEDVIEAGLIFRLTNHMPIGVSAKVYLSSDSTNLYSDTISDSSEKFIISDLNIPSAPVDGNGLVTQSLVRDIEIPLTKPLIEFIASAYDRPIYTGFKTIIDGTSTEVIIHADDYVTSRGKFRIRFFIDSNK